MFVLSFSFLAFPCEKLEDIRNSISLCDFEVNLLSRFGVVILNEDERSESQLKNLRDAKVTLKVAWWKRVSALLE